MTSAAKANRNAEIVDRLEAENARLRELSQNNAHSWDALVRERDALREANDRQAATILRQLEGLEKVRSYNVDIAAGRINCRPEDHIQVIDRALQQPGAK